LKRITLLTLVSLFGLACQFSALSSAVQLELPMTPSPIPSPSSTPGASLCTVKAKSLNVRAASGIDSNVLAWLHRGDVVTILSDPPEGNWIHIRTQGGIEGWINSKYCEVKP
jgi:uncharacterized protein YgiM (DUF1202 family)